MSAVSRPVPVRLALPRLRRAPSILAACAALAALSLPLSASPHYDAWAWLVWGREIVHGLDLVTVGGPSWKPLPVLCAALFAPFGSAAPALWLVVARAGGLLALVAAYRLAHRVAGRVAGWVAALALVLSHAWLLDLAWGATEPLLVAFLLWAVLAHLDDRPGWALGLLWLGAQLRPEVWPFLGLYALWLWRRRDVRRSSIAAALLTVPLLWLGPDWYSTGDPLTGVGVAHGSLEARVTQNADAPLLEALGRLGSLILLPLWALALAAAALAWRAHERLVRALAALTLAWIALVAVLTVFGYAGLERFLLPAGAMGCVLAGIGAAGIVRAASGRVVAYGLGALLVAVTGAFALPRAAASMSDVRAGDGDVALRALDLAIAAAGGRGRLRACGTPVVNGALLPALAWRLRTHLDEVRPEAGAPPYVAFAAAPTLFTGPPPASRPGERALAAAEPWRVVAAGSSAPCPSSVVDVRERSG